MRFTFYTSKTLKECTSELSKRFQEKETKARPAISGEVNKEGDFLLTSSRKVWFLNRQTRMNGHITRENNLTTVKGYVHEGVLPQQMYVIMGGGLLMATVFFLSGQGIGAIVLGAISLLTYPFFVGDYYNSQYLLKELKKTLNTKDKPPAISVSTKSSSTLNAPKRPMPARTPAPAKRTPTPAKTPARAK